MELIDTLKTNTYIPERDVQGPFIFSVDHCFSIRGQGTVMTGTALSGSVSVNDVGFFSCIRSHVCMFSIVLYLVNMNESHFRDLVYKLNSSHNYDIFFLAVFVKER